MIHSVLGVFSGILTLASGLYIIHSDDWIINTKMLHNVAGTVYLAICLSLVVGGIFALTMRRYVNFDGKTKDLLRIIKFHGYFGYFVIISV